MLDLFLSEIFIFSMAKSIFKSTLKHTAWTTKAYSRKSIHYTWMSLPNRALCLVFTYLPVPIPYVLITTLFCSASFSSRITSKGFPPMALLSLPSLTNKMIWSKTKASLIKLLDERIGKKRLKVNCININD